MKAIAQDVYGPPDVLRLVDLDRPVPGERQVLIEVHAAGLDPGVWHLMTGLPYLVRVMGYGLRKPKVRIRGRDVAGTVAAIGDGVTRFRPGDEVFGICEGSFAEYAVADEAKIVAKPAKVSFHEAAVVPISGLTALQGIRDVARVTPGRSVLVVGAAGGVGLFAVQIAKSYGAEVTGVCSTAKLDLVRSAGADHAIDYTREDFADGRRRWDVIVDTAGRRPLSKLRRALARRGTLVIVGGEGGGRVLGGFDRQIVRAPLLSLFSGQKIRPLVSKEPTADLLVLKDLLEAGAIRPVIDHVYPLSETPDAIRSLAQGHARGKIVISI